MQLRTCLLIPLALCGAAAYAQDTQPIANPHSTVFPTQDGELVVNWGQPPARDFGPPPPFEQLAQGAAFITPDQAAAYPPLANDWIHADRNHDNRLTRAEYDRWSRSSP